MMNDFITGLQFLTRIHIVKQTEWSAASFGRSVKYFPLIGGLIGLCLFLFSYFFAVYCPVHVFAALVVLVEIALTGGLHCDGFMDTMDGILSGRSRERMLEIMKDSRVGANGVMAFTLLILVKWSLILDIRPHLLPAALLVMPVLGRMAMVMGITLFPYARPEGIGKAFAQFAGKSSVLAALFFTALIILPLGYRALASGAVVILFSYVFCRFIIRVLGGLTGDVYGAVTELAEIIVLVTFVI